MARANARNIRRVPGRLIKDPTDLTASFPFGGTELGTTGAMEFRPNIQTSQTLDEGIGRPIRTTVTAEQAVFAGVLRDFDEDALKLLFHNTTAGKRAVVINGRAAGAGFNRAGFNVSSKAFLMLFSPFAKELHDHILFYAAVPLVEETAALQLGLNAEFNFGVFFSAHPDSTARDYDVGRLDDLDFP